MSSEVGAQGAGSGLSVTVCLWAFLQSTFVNRPALGILPPENFVEKLQESLLSVSGEPVGTTSAAGATPPGPGPSRCTGSSELPAAAPGEGKEWEPCNQDRVFLCQSLCCFFHKEYFYFSFGRKEGIPRVQKKGNSGKINVCPETGALHVMQPSSMVSVVTTIKIIPNLNVSPAKCEKGVAVASGG